MTSPVSAIEAIEKAMERRDAVEWGQDEFLSEIVIDPNPPRHKGAIVCEARNKDVAAYIAACNPVAMREVLALARQAEALQRENAEKDAEISKLIDFVGKAQGVAIGVAMSGRAHPNPDGALMGIFKDGQELIEASRARALLGGENAE